MIAKPCTETRRKNIIFQQVQRGQDPLDRARDVRLSVGLRQLRGGRLRQRPRGQVQRAVGHPQGGARGKGVAGKGTFFASLASAKRNDIN